MKKQIFITLDMDWACDEVLQDTYSLIQENDIFITMNVTHNTRMLPVFREDSRIELGIHPNFNPHMNNQTNVNYKQTIEKIIGFVPEAITVRCHALMEGSLLMQEFANKGLTYELNSYTPPHKGTVLLPFSRYNKILKVPSIYEDDLYLGERFKYDVDYYLGYEFTMLKVFTFHPMHLFLNTEKLERYEECKKHYKEIVRLESLRNKETKGIRDFFLELIKKGKEQGYEFCCIRDIEIGDFY